MSVGAIIIFLFVLGIGVYAIREKPQIFGLSKGTQQLQAEADTLVADVGRLIALPEDEKPTIATVTDDEKIKEQTLVPTQGRN